MIIHILFLLLYAIASVQVVMSVSEWVTLFGNSRMEEIKQRITDLTYHNFHLPHPSPGIITHGNLSQFSAATPLTWDENTWELVKIFTCHTHSTGIITHGSSCNMDKGFLGSNFNSTSTTSALAPKVIILS